MKKITPYLALIIITLSSFFAGYYCNRGRDKPTTEVVTVETVTDTIPHIAPKPVSELGLSTQTFTLPRYYFIGSAGGKPRQQSLCTNTDTLSAITYTTMPVTIGDAYSCAIGEADSTVVELPIIQRHYADKDYDAWLSGPLNPQLDSIKVYATTNIVTKREYKPPNRWHIGVTAGYGYSPQGFQPYIGVGITYSIFSF